MKKLIIFIFSLILICSCEQKQTSYTKEDIQFVIIDSCEYIKNNVYGMSTSCYTHKGNCKYCKERRIQELKKFYYDSN